MLDAGLVETGPISLTAPYAAIWSLFTLRLTNSIDASEAGTIARVEFIFLRGMCRYRP